MHFETRKIVYLSIQRFIYLFQLPIQTFILGFARRFKQIYIVAIYVWFVFELNVYIEKTLFV